MIDTEELANRLLDARKAYYESDSPLMSDEDFDSLEELLRKQEPNHEYFKRVGYLGPESDSGGKIRHRVPMLSMGKVKNLQGAEKWLRRLKLQPPYTLAVQPKIDGLSASLAYADGRLSYVATRGDGEVGQDITHIAAYVKDIPEEIAFTKEHVEIRGELHLPRDTEYDTGNRPLRNNCIGLINRKGNRKKLLKDLKYVRFLAYQIIWPEAGHSISGATAAPQSVSKTEPRFNSEFGKIDILAESGFYTFEEMAADS